MSTLIRLRTTEKLRKELRLRPGDLAPCEANDERPVLTDWHASIFSHRRRKVVLFIEARTYFCLATYKKGKFDITAGFVQALRSAWGPTALSPEHLPAFEDDEARIEFSKNPDRRLTGKANDIIFQLESQLDRFTDAALSADFEACLAASVEDLLELPHLQLPRTLSVDALRDELGLPADTESRRQLSPIQSDAPASASAASPSIRDLQRIYVRTNGDDPDLDLWFDYLDQYAHQSLLDEDERALRTGTASKNEGFCAGHSAGAMSAPLSQFLEWFLPRKVLASPGQLKAIAAKVRDFLEWTSAGNWIPPSQSERVRLIFAEHTANSAYLDELNAALAKAEGTGDNRTDFAAEILHIEGAVSLISGDRFVLDDLYGDNERLRVKAGRPFCDLLAVGAYLAADVVRDGKSARLIALQAAVRP
ncbi:MAG: hypothetical protein NXI24_04935 [bacterium]|nr:hypothetical protein [bacterium]